jgi:ATP adenylyltransferase
MADCRFCGPHFDKNQQILQESEHAWVIFSNPRLMKGHLLVIPKRHVERPWELTDAELMETFEHIRELQKKLSETLGTGCDLRQHYRPFMSEGRIKVNHMHFHLLPRTLRDDLYERSMKYETNIFSELSEAEVEEMRSVLQKG